jgi:hypothetical protein
VLKDVILAILKLTHELGTVTFACNLSYLGGKDQEDRSVRPTWAES